MGLMTPRGLKVRLELPWAFGLLARLWIKNAKTDAFRVLKTCEAIEEAPEVLALVAGFVVVVWGEQLPVWTIPLALVLGRVAGILLTQLGFIVVVRSTGLLFLAHIFSYVCGYGVLFVAEVPIVVYFRSWVGAMWWVAGLILSEIVAFFVEHPFVSWHNRVIGQPFTSSEINFFIAYRLHAQRLGISQDLDVSDAEVEDGAWRSCLLDYATKYPKAVLRFPSGRGVLDALTPPILEEQADALFKRCMSGLGGRENPPPR
ncbi:MAG TPA: hypothetical protein PKK06_07920 [Phycisphaerae bacterium]|nr:hypothetical protein [Phycisphaerae bacterium]HNU46036.1 hypothetical protein [Phycisphaerae bacterium]